jgi:hypothetical protein
LPNGPTAENPARREIWKKISTQMKMGVDFVGMQEAVYQEEFNRDLADVSLPFMQDYEYLRPANEKVDGLFVTSIYNKSRWNKIADGFGKYEFGRAYHIGLYESKNLTNKVKALVINAHAPHKKSVGFGTADKLSLPQAEVEKVLKQAIFNPAAPTKKAHKIDMIVFSGDMNRQVDNGQIEIMGYPLALAIDKHIYDPDNGKQVNMKTYIGLGSDPKTVDGWMWGTPNDHGPDHVLYHFPNHKNALEFSGVENIHLEKMSDYEKKASDHLAMKGEFVIGVK